MNVKRVLLIPLIILLNATAPAHAAGTGQANTSTVNLTYSVEDTAFDGPECAQVKWTANYSKPASARLTLRMDLEQESSNRRLDEARASAQDVSTSGLLTGMLCVPVTADVTLGGFRVVPQIDVMDSGAMTTVLGQPVRLTVTRNASHLESFKVRTGMGMTWISGRAVAAAPGKGTIGATGWVYFQRRDPQGWRTIGREWLINGYGNFQEDLMYATPKGTKIRVILTECSWCTNARAVTQVKVR